MDDSLDSRDWNTDANELARAYTRSHDFWRLPQGLLIAGLGWTALGVGGFFGLALLELGWISRAIACGIVSLGLATLARVIGALRTPIRVILDDEGLIVERARGKRQYRWTEFAHSAVSTSGPPEEHYMVLYDQAGRQVEKLTGLLDGFQELSKRVTHAVKVARAGAVTRVGLQRHWLLALVMISGGAVLFGTSIFFAGSTMRVVAKSWSLKSDGVDGEAVVTDLYSGSQYGLVYEITDASGRQAKRSTELEETFWGGLEVGARIAVRYVPGEPENSALVSGERDPVSLMGWTAFLGIWLFGVAMGAVFIGAGALHLARVDIRRRPGGWGLVIQREQLY